ncbi:MAG TPA: carbamoyltransferase HypF [Desulfobacteraceae bacterium]|nr:carbamoyltransferase HypF [Desulfobacteraceae bacterium]
MIAKHISINGIVQGVGFRPFVYGLAKRLQIRGQVANTSSGVIIRAEGREPDIDLFCKELSANPPPLSRITDILIISEQVQGFTDFSIVLSQSHSDRTTLISPDVSVCEDCLREMNNPEDRRYRYPFINCTNCGPRYTIISDIPYDRRYTSMKNFRMCKECQAEYDNPEDRRFHAQPNACPDCGPHVELYDNKTPPPAPPRNGEGSFSVAPPALSGKGDGGLGPDTIHQTALLLKQGCIVAIKGLGGFHLAADAHNDAAVNRLRERKRREEKPFALMSCDMETIRNYAHVLPEEEALLKSHQRPIVLLRKKEPNFLSAAIAPKNNYFGVMLPYTPLHYILLSHFALCTLHFALVMTSANLTDEPIVIDNDEAFDRLSDIADFFLIHNRDIYLRSDDSIIRMADEKPRFIRRSRGYVPTPIFLSNAKCKMQNAKLKTVPSVLACGAELKNTVTLTKGDKAFISQHIGDMENPLSYDFFKMTIRHLKQILDITPEIIAHDLHPGYFSTAYASEQENIQKIGVQHHHAHIVSCMAEHKISGPVIGLAFDGTGFGTDGNLWGGEILIADEKSFERAAHLNYVPMPGGAAAIKEPWRMAISYLHNAFGDEIMGLDLPIVREKDAKTLNVIIQMIKKHVNSPLTSGMGRLFDGVAGIMGIRNRVCFEGQAAMELEMASILTQAHYDYDRIRQKNVYQILTAPIVRGIVRDMMKRKSAAEIGGKFHASLICLFSDLCAIIGRENGLKRVVFSGGSFQNIILLKGLRQSLESSGFEVFSHCLVPTNDGGISLGQAVIAAGFGLFSKRQ